MIRKLIFASSLFCFLGIPLVLSDPNILVDSGIFGHVALNRWGIVCLVISIGFSISTWILTERDRHRMKMERNQ